MFAPIDASSRKDSNFIPNYVRSNIKKSALIEVRRIAAVYLLKSFYFVLKQLQIRKSQFVNF